MNGKKLGLTLVTMTLTCSACAVDGTASAPSSGEEKVASTAAALSVNDTPLPVDGWHGGNGGDVYTENYCDAGYVVVGFYGSAGTTMDNIGLHCAALNANGTWRATYNRPPVGGTGGNFYSSWCAPNTWVTEVAYQYESTVNQLWMKCGNGNLNEVAGTFSEYFVGDNCSSYGAVKGLRMISHTYVDRVQTMCATIEP